MWIGGLDHWAHFTRIVQLIGLRNLDLQILEYEFPILVTKNQAARKAVVNGWSICTRTATASHGGDCGSKRSTSQANRHGIHKQAVDVAIAESRHVAQFRRPILDFDGERVVRVCRLSGWICPHPRHV